MRVDQPRWGGLSPKPPKAFREFGQASFAPCPQADKPWGGFESIRPLDLLPVPAGLVPALLCKDGGYSFSSQRWRAHAIGTRKPRQIEALLARLWLPFPHALTAASARPRYLAFFRPVSKIPPHLMRPPVRLQKLETLMAPMGRRVKSAGRIYLAGGATALLHG